jgi:hypothetical protein
MLTFLNNNHSKGFLFIFSLFRWCCFSRRIVEVGDETTSTTSAAPKPCFLFQPLQFEVGDYVLDLTYTQTLCW